MALRGRKSKPDALKKIQGNPGKRRIAKAAAGAKDANAFAAPATLTDAERKVWDEMIGTLRQLNFVRDSDLRAFGRFVKFQALFDTVAPMVSSENLVEVTVSDKVTMERLNKRFLAMMHIDKRLEAYDERFGTNPAARQALMSRLAAGSAQLPLMGRAETESKKSDAPKQTEQPVPAEAAPRPASPIGFGRLN